MASVMAATVLAVAQMGGRSLALANDGVEAEVLAQAAVEYAQAKMAADSSWRDTYANNTESAAVPLGRGTFTFKFVDEADGDLADSGDTPARIFGTGRVGKAVKVFSLDHRPARPLDGLKVSVATGGTIDFNRTIVTGSKTVASNATITADKHADFGGTRLEAVGGISISTAGGTGGRVSPAAARQLPQPARAFSYYVANGTAVPVTSFPTVGGSKAVRYRLFSPSAHPTFGTPNAKGIYVIDCQGWNVVVSDCRVAGTLVLLNTTSGCVIQGSNYFAPSAAYPNYPSLLVKGNLVVKTNNSPLADDLLTGDSSVPLVNYNPPGTPFNGTSDVTFSTTYPSRFDGLVYVSGNLVTQTHPWFNGVLLVGGTLDASGALGLGYDATPYTNPPPGFFTPQLVPVAGSWRWEKVP